MESERDRMIPNTSQFTNDSNQSIVASKPTTVAKPQVHSTSGSNTGSAGGHGSAIASPSSKEVSF